ncbi:hypothetical protein Slin15195_G018760 [Septoria linicola]|uniref:Uncharacterized protein n=1 Tax=Septoria linicola TaxID=215465 RepID=A0A9Q9EGA0_9PEZI|nr:hypothetical protein Slin15195_G018760 [Septoria linicola]
MDKESRTKLPGFGLPSQAPALKCQERIMCSGTRSTTGPGPTLPASPGTPAFPRVDFTLNPRRRTSHWRNRVPWETSWERSHTEYEYEQELWEEQQKHNSARAFGFCLSILGFLVQLEPWTWSFPVRFGFDILWKVILAWAVIRFLRWLAGVAAAVSGGSHVRTTPGELPGEDSDAGAERDSDEEAPPTEPALTGRGSQQRSSPGTNDDGVEWSQYEQMTKELHGLYDFLLDRHEVRGVQRIDRLKLYRLAKWTQGIREIQRRLQDRHLTDSTFQQATRISRTLPLVQGFAQAMLTKVHPENRNEIHVASLKIIGIANAHQLLMRNTPPAPPRPVIQGRTTPTIETYTAEQLRIRLHICCATLSESCSAVDNSLRTLPSDIDHVALQRFDDEVKRLRQIHDSILTLELSEVRRYSMTLLECRNNLECTMRTLHGIKAIAPNLKGQRAAQKYLDAVKPTRNLLKLLTEPDGQPSASQGARVPDTERTEPLVPSGLDPVIHNWRPVGERVPDRSGSGVTSGPAVNNTPNVEVSRPVHSSETLGDGAMLQHWARAVSDMCEACHALWTWHNGVRHDYASLPHLMSRLSGAVDIVRDIDRRIVWTYALRDIPTESEAEVLIHIPQMQGLCDGQNFYEEHSELLRAALATLFLVKDRFQRTSRRSRRTSIDPRGGILGGLQSIMNGIIQLSQRRVRIRDDAYALGINYSTERLTADRQRLNKQLWPLLTNAKMIALGATSEDVLNELRDIERAVTEERAEMQRDIEQSSLRLVNDDYTRNFANEWLQDTHMSGMSPLTPRLPFMQAQDSAINIRILQEAISKTARKVGQLALLGEEVSERGYIAGKIRNEIMDQIKILSTKVDSNNEDHRTQIDQVLDSADAQLKLLNGIAPVPASAALVVNTVTGRHERRNLPTSTWRRRHNVSGSQRGRGTFGVRTQPVARVVAPAAPEADTELQQQQGEVQAAVPVQEAGPVQKAGPVQEAGPSTQTPAGQGSVTPAIIPQQLSRVQAFTAEWVAIRNTVEAWSTDEDPGMRALYTHSLAAITTPPANDDSMEITQKERPAEEAEREQNVLQSQLLRVNDVRKDVRHIVFRGHELRNATRPPLSAAELVEVRQIEASADMGTKFLRYAMLDLGKRIIQPEGAQLTYQQAKFFAELNCFIEMNAATSYQGRYKNLSDVQKVEREVLVAFHAINYKACGGEISTQVPHFRHALQQLEYLRAGTDWQLWRCHLPRDIRDYQKILQDTATHSDHYGKLYDYMIARQEHGLHVQGPAYAVQHLRAHVSEGNFPVETDDQGHMSALRALLGSLENYRSRQDMVEDGSWVGPRSIDQVLELLFIEPPLPVQLPYDGQEPLDSAAGRPLPHLQPANLVELTADYAMFLARYFEAVAQEHGQASEIYRQHLNSVRAYNNWSAKQIQAVLAFFIEKRMVPPSCTNLRLGVVTREVDDRDPNTKATAEVLGDNPEDADAGPILWLFNTNLGSIDERCKSSWQGFASDAVQPPTSKEIIDSWFEGTRLPRPLPYLDGRESTRGDAGEDIVNGEHQMSGGNGAAPPIPPGDTMPVLQEGANRLKNLWDARTTDVPDGSIAHTISVLDEWHAALINLKQRANNFINGDHTDGEKKPYQKFVKKMDGCIKRNRDEYGELMRRPGGLDRYDTTGTEREGQARRDERPRTGQNEAGNANRSGQGGQGGQGDGEGINNNENGGESKPDTRGKGKDSTHDKSSDDTGRAGQGHEAQAKGKQGRGARANGEGTAGVSGAGTGAGTTGKRPNNQQGGTGAVTGPKLWHGTESSATKEAKANADKLKKAGRHHGHEVDAEPSNGEGQDAESDVSKNAKTKKQNRRR